jgi:hypothetical protein
MMHQFHAIIQRIDQFHAIVQRIDHFFEAIDFNGDPVRLASVELNDSSSSGV